MKYAEALAFLDGLVNYEKQAGPRDRFKLDNIRRLLELAGNPQERMGRTVLVAGTKGKGSVCYMLEAALRACGCSTGMFVSPHVRTVRERIQLGGEPISRRTFAQAVARLKPLVKQQPVSYFELTAALAFDIFARVGPDYAVIEVGLGGRLDATNVSDPAVSVITRVGLDHTRVLGSSLTAIAREKAGIMRSGRPVVIGRQDPVAARGLRRCAGKTASKPVPVDAMSRVFGLNLTARGVEFSVMCDLGAGRVRLSLLGGHQEENCVTAMVALGELARSDERIRLPRVLRGLRRVVIPARCQLVEDRPPLVVDSCHNPDSGAALARTIADHIGRKVILVYGSLRGKLIHGTVKPLARWTRAAVLVRPDSPRAAEPGKLRSVFGRLGVPYVWCSSVRKGLEHARSLSGAKLPIVVAGSFYVAGEALAAVEPASDNAR